MIDDPQYRIIIIGGGNIGFRHFEGIIKLNLPVQIYIIDPSEKAFSKFNDTFLPGKRNFVSMKFKRSLRFKKTFFDLAIIATTSDQRLEVTKNLIDNHEVKNIVLEKLITGVAYEMEELENALIKHENVWINYPRRSMAFYQNTKRNMKFRENLDIEVDGTDWNFISNTPHFIDLIEYFSNSKLKKVDFSGLDLEWKSTRPSFSDTTGKISCLFSNDVAMHIGSSKKDSDDFKSLQISLRANNLNGLIDELSGKATGGLFNQNVSGKIDFQSDLTGSLTLQILRNGTCALTSFREAKESFLIYLNSLETYFDQNNLSTEIKVT